MHAHAMRSSIQTCTLFRVHMSTYLYNTRIAPVGTLAGVYKYGRSQLLPERNPKRTFGLSQSWQRIFLSVRRFGETREKLVRPLASCQKHDSHCVIDCVLVISWQIYDSKIPIFWCVCCPIASMYAHEHPLEMQPVTPSNYLCSERQTAALCGVHALNNLCQGI